MSEVTHGEIGEIGGDGAHERPLAAVAVAAAAEHGEQAAGRDRAHGAQHVGQRIGRVRVVDQHAEGLTGTDGLEPPRHARGAREPAAHGLERQAHGQRRGRRGEGVGHVEARRRLDLQRVAQAETRRDQLEGGALGAQDEVGGDAVGPARGAVRPVVDGEGPQVGAVRPAAVIDQAATVVVARVHDGGRARSPPFVGQKQRALGGEVVVEGLVKVEMVARQVREDDRLEDDTGRALERQSMRRGLHDARPVAAVDHRAEHALQLDRVGGRELRRPLDSGDAVDDGAQKARPQAGRREDLGQQVSGRGLAVGAGDGGDAQLARRIAEEQRRHEGHGVPRSGHEDLGDGQGERAFADEGDRPGGDRLGGEVVPVGLQSGDAEEERSGSDVTGAAGQRSDFDVGIAVDATSFKTGGECGYVHAGR